MKLAITKKPAATQTHMFPDHVNKRIILSLSKLHSYVAVNGNKNEMTKQDIPISNIEIGNTAFTLMITFIKAVAKIAPSTT